MVSILPKGLYTMEKKYAIIRANAKIYQKGRKKLKTQILNGLERILGMNRQYLSFPPQSVGGSDEQFVGRYY